MSNLKNILQSFQLKEELNPKIWEKSKNEEYSMRPKVRTHLLEIAHDFIDSLNVDIVVSDVIMTGSLANYNWSNYSDVDIHIIADFNQFPENVRPLYDELFRLKKTVYGLKRKITIFGYDVELYVEDESISRDVQSAGRFSLLMDEWVVKPVKESVEINVNNIQEKAKKWMKIIDGVEENIKDEDIDTAKKLIKNYVTKIRKFRECGLEKGGEYSDENLVFKILRRNGYLEKIKDMKDSLVDNKLTLKESTTTLGGVFKTDLENSPSNHSKRALGNWQSDNAWDVFASPGTVVNSYTEGTVSKIRDTGKNSGKIFGTQVSIKGNDDFPDIFYTHLKNVKLKNGDVVKVGDYIGEISEWIGHEGMTHVHIGLPRGNHLKDLLVNSDKIFTGSKDSTITPHSDSTFLSSLENISSSGKEFKNLKSPGKSIPYDSDVEKIQTALQILGYSLPKWGVDGLFGPETESAVLKFESDNGITPDGKLTDDDIGKILELLETKGFEESDLGRIQKTSDFDKINIGGDKDFYESVLKGIGAPITDENMKFLYAWRKGEGGKATNNPFNTTFNLKKDSGISNYNTVGVKNYSNPNYGVEATVKTLLLPYYTCITDGLKKDIGSDKISRCESLKTWGTGDLVAKVLNSGNVTPPKIYNA
jgi:peptidoglycan hydrolase-like protein with peptidoglycan-binding domain